jgi:SAM-dependent methyltransferase
VRREDDVLEVAAGTGLLTVHLARRARRVVCTDFSPRMLRIAEKKLAVFPNAQTALADAADLPFRSGSFDLVVCSHALHVMAAPEIAIREFRRVLRPGGRVIAVTLLDGEMNLAMLARSAFTFLPRFGCPPCRRTLRLGGFVDLVGSSGLVVEEAVIVAQRPIPTGYVIARKPGGRLLGGEEGVAHQGAVDRCVHRPQSGFGLGRAAEGQRTRS